MNLLLRAAAAAALLLPLAVAPATAQDYRGAWTLYGGGIWFSDLNNNGDFDLVDVDPDLLDEFFFIDDIVDLDDIGFLDLTLEPGWVAGTQLEYWFGNGRFGLRANGGYTERSFDLEGDDADFFFGLGDDDDFTFGDVNVWLLDGDLMVRLLRPSRDRTFAPFVTLGAGVVIYNPAGSTPIVVPAANSVVGDVDIDVFEENGDEFLVITGDGNSETKFATPIGIGADILPGWNIGNLGLGLRLELVDHIAWDSPAEPLFGDDDFDPVHNVRLTAGLMGLFGRLFREEVVAVTPPPAPPPPPAPVEEAITVCVINPATYEVGYVDALYLPATRDTVVVRNGQRIELGSAVRGLRLARDLPGFVSGEPVTLSVAGTQWEYVTYGGTRIIEPDDLAFVGTIDGVPVYADENDVDNVMDEIDDLRDDHGDDLEDMLEESAELRDAMNEVEVLYVPTEAIGCVFQPLRRVEEVRKVRG